MIVLKHLLNLKIIYTVLKKKIKFKIENELKKENKNTSYDNFCKKFHNDNIYLIDIKKK